MKVYGDFQVFTTNEAIELLKNVDHGTPKIFICTDAQPDPEFATLIHERARRGFDLVHVPAPDALKKRDPGLIDELLEVSDAWDKKGTALVHRNKETAYTLAHIVGWWLACRDDEEYNYAGPLPVAPCYSSYISTVIRGEDPD